MLYKSPEVSEGRSGGEELNHPAFGTMVLTTLQGGDEKLFGSDVKNNQRLRIEICRAQMTRSLSKDWFFARERIVSFELSYSQFVSHVMSAGKGEGVPITLRCAPAIDSTMEEIPGIKDMPSVGTNLKREIRETAQKTIEDIQFELNRLKEMVNAGPASKKKLEDIIFQMQNRLNNAAPNLEFVVNSAQEAIETLVANAKVEVEAYIDIKARQLGLERIQDLAALENKE